MSSRYADEGMNLLTQSLQATGVLSEGYRREIEGYALRAVGEAHARGVEAGKERAAEEPFNPNHALAPEQEAIKLVRSMDDETLRAHLERANPAADDKPYALRVMGALCFVWARRNDG